MDASSDPREAEPAGRHDEEEPGQDDEDPLLSEEEEDSEDDEDSIDPTVFQVACGKCGCTLSRRGMMVCLVTDRSKSLYSTDIPADGIREHGAPRTIETCECLIRSLGCSGCEHEVGYHVTQPCEVCTLHDHNGHYWLFLAAAVAAAKRYAARRGEAGSDEAGGEAALAAGSGEVGGGGAGGGAGCEAEGGGTVLRWSQLAYNGVEDGRAAAREEGGEEADGEGAAAGDEERCPVCFCR